MAQIISNIEITIEIDTDANIQTVSRKYDGISRFELIGPFTYELERIIQLQWNDDHQPEESEVKPDEPE